MRTLAAVLALGLLVAAAPAWPLAPAAPAASHGLSIHGDLKYGPGFAHFAYVNPQAPKGGSVTLAAIGTFDNLNPFILKGVPAAGIAMTFDTLTVASGDEPASEYGLVAETIETPPDRSWVAFTLRPDRALSRRQPHHRRGRPVDVRDAAHQGAPPLPVVLRPGGERRADGPAHGALLVQGGGQP